MSATVILETNRLVLTTWTETAVDEVLEMHSHPDVARYLNIEGKGYDRAKAEARVAGWRQEYAENGLGKHRMSRKADGQFVGRAGFSQFIPGTAEIGYSLARSHWGQGYASEIAQALSDWLFETRRDASFIGFAHRDNAASRRVLEKIGMQPTHEGIIADMPHQFYIKQRPA
jgi:ribosomal-protein-alanine N-acetyltransferase